MTDQHPITLPPNLQNLWVQQAQRLTPNDIIGWLDYVATQAAQWGGDQELEACCVLMDDWGLDGKDLIERRRPKPPSLKEQALDALREAESTGCLYVNGRSDLIRRALEALPE